MPAPGVLLPEHDDSTVHGLHGGNGDAILPECNGMHGYGTGPGPDAIAAAVRWVHGRHGDARLPLP